LSAAAFLARYRVRLGYPLAIAVFWLAHPTPLSILCGTLAGIPGLLLRARAAGYLHKQQVLTVGGPYAYTRNPLYLGSALLALGAAIATHSWLSAAVLAAYFALFYSVVMRREEQELRQQHGAAFDQYARVVPLFFPRWTPAVLSASSFSTFSFAQYKKNHEWQAFVGFLLLLAVLVVLWRLGLH
jgi:protein-S-isoprenylcysteine O-methyltransferase Ste14